jgi:lipid II:glycine glycyltransferase (peptidoglycan interpeptide bridge formation enzyme)
MKRILLMSLLAGSLLFAEGTSNKSQIKTMQTLESAMEMVQKGFLYNNSNIIENAIVDLKRTLLEVNAFEIKVDPKEQGKDFNAKAYVSTEVTAIDKLVTEMGKLYKEGKKDEALATFSKTLSRCVVCHKVIRKW